MEDFTMESRESNPYPLQPSVACFQPTNTKIQLVESVPDSTTHATFIQHPLSSLVKSRVKHLGMLHS